MFQNASSFNQYIQLWNISDDCSMNNMSDGATLMNNIYDAPSTPTNSFFNKRTLLTNDSDSSANIYTVFQTWMTDPNSTFARHLTTLPYLVLLNIGIHQL